MGIYYSTQPKDFMELCDSIRGQLERTRELAMAGKQITLEESVEITPEAFLSVLERIEELTRTLTEQALLFVMVQNIFKYLFESLGVEFDVDEEFGSVEDGFYDDGLGGEGFLDE
jgi:hypothetical protein